MSDKTRAELKDTAYAWACDYISSQEEIDLTCVFEGMTDEEWAEHLEFITDCFEHGFKPTHFVDMLICQQKEFNDAYNTDISEEDELFGM